MHEALATIRLTSEAQPANDATDNSNDIQKRHSPLSFQGAERSRGRKSKQRHSEQIAMGQSP